LARGLLLAVVVASLGVAYQEHRFARAGARYDRFELPGFDAHVYVAMATRPSVFTVAPWGYRLLTPALVEALPVRTVRAFRDVTAVGLVATGALLFLWLRRLGNAEWAALLAVIAFSLSGPVAEAVQYRFLVEPVTAALAVAFLLGLATGAPVAVLALVAALGTLSKEFFLLLLPLVFLERRAAAGWRRALAETALVAAPSILLFVMLRWFWTPYLRGPLPRIGARLVADTLERFYESFRDWRAAVLLGGLTPLALAGTLLPKGRPHLARSAWLFLVTLVPPFLNPVAFFARDIPRLLLYALPAVLPLALVALDRLLPHLTAPRPRRAAPPWVSWAASMALVVVMGTTWRGVDPYRRVDLQGPRDGPLVLAACRESLRTATRLERGEEVRFDLEDQFFVWGTTPLYEFHRMRWFLRDGWGERPQYSVGDAVMQSPEAELLLPVLDPRDVDMTLDLGAPPRGATATVNGHRLIEGSLENTVLSLHIPGSVLFRGDNRLVLASPAGTSLRRLVLTPGARAGVRAYPERPAAPQGAE
jgi:hypothetical protein